MLPSSLLSIDVSGGDHWRTPHNLFTGGIPPEWGTLTNLKMLKMARCGLDGAYGSTRTVSCWSVLFYLVGRLSILPWVVVPGWVPTELAELTNLTTLYLNGNRGLQVPEGAVLDPHGDMRYDDLHGTPVAPFLHVLRLWRETQD